MIPKDKLALIPKLGFGFMRLPVIGGDDGNIDLAKTAEMADLYLASGMNYFDTAYVYHKGRSEVAIRETLVKRHPRESFTIADKLPLWSVREPKDCERLFRESLDRLGTDYIDFYLMHCLTRENIRVSDKSDIWGFMRGLRADGRARYIGFSFHDSPDVLEEILAKHHEMMDFVQLQINYYDWLGDMRSNEYYAIARKYDVPIIVMEPVRGGSLVSLPKSAEDIFRTENPGASNASWAIRYCASKPGVMTVLSGMSEPGQVADNVSYMKDFRPFTEAEEKAVGRVAELLSKIETVPCTACKYCDECPQGIDIPFALAAWNDYRKDMKHGAMKEKIAKMKAAPASCIECGACEAKCPQKIEIIRALKEI